MPQKNAHNRVRLSARPLEDRVTPNAAIGVLDAASGAITAYDPGGAPLAVPTDGAVAGGRFALADVTGDGVDDRIVGVEPGGRPSVTVLDGATGEAARRFDAYEPAFLGGVYVGSADLNGDGFAEVVTGTDQGGGPRVRVFDGASLAAGGEAALADFLAIDDSDFRGGVRIGLGDIDGDGTADLLVGAGFSGGPRVTALDGSELAGGSAVKLFGDFFAFEGSLRNGVHPAVGDLDGDGLGELIFGAGPGGGPRVRALDGAAMMQGRHEAVADFFAGDTSGRDGVRVGVVPLAPESFEPPAPQSPAPPQPPEEPPQPPQSPEKPPGVTEFRSIDGTGNNVENPEWGSTGEQLLRSAASDYADGLSAPAGEDRPSAREVSNAVSAQAAEGGNENGTSAMLLLWGQFLDHDLDLTEPPHDGTGESLPIEVPAGDPFFDPFGTGTATIDFTRSAFDEETGTDTPREHLNAITAFIDGSMVYGSDDEAAASLREFTGGRMLVDEDGLLPTDDEGMFMAGDVRANENIMLTSMHTLFVREHNRLAAEIAAADPGLSDEDVYQRARARVIAQIQAITYNEFLPALLGDGAPSPYSGYDASVNPNIATEFSTAGFRFGHSMINEEIVFVGNDGQAARDAVALSEAFFNPSLLAETGIDSILKGTASVQSNAADLQVVDSLRNFLFGPPGAGGFDLVSLNIQRGRDHGLADYNTVREAYGLDRVSSFAEITSDGSLAAALEELYVTVDNIDLWVGVLAEDAAGGGALGELGRAIIVDQFERLRAGDRFWYENTMSPGEIREVDRTSLADVIERNTGVGGLQDDVFHMRASVGGVVFADRNGDGDQQRPERGLAGVEVELLDAGGAVVASDFTRRDGSYRFNGVAATGEYAVRVVVPAGSSATTDESLTALIAAGGDRAGGLDFGLSPGRR